MEQKMNTFKQKLKKNSLVIFIVYFFKMIYSIIKYPFLHHDNKIKKYHNLHLGEECFIIATGPSLTISDLELIKGYKSFSVNSIIKSFDKTSWRPDYYLVSDKIPFKAIKQSIDKKDFEEIFLAKGIGKLSEAVYFSLNNISRAKCQMTGNYIKKLYPSKNLKKTFNNAPSVIFSAIQLAVYMGFKKIYLLGQDCNYSSKNSHSNIASVQYSIKATQKEADNMIDVFSNFACFYKDKDIKIYNCTRGGNLEVFERLDLEKAINQ